jgi:putative transcriptional regulator
MSKHHPTDALLLQYATGTLDPASAMVVGAHVEQCAHCAAQVKLLDTVGGVLLEDIDPVPMDESSYAKVLARLDDQTQAFLPQPATQNPRPDLPAGLQWPASLDGCTISPWKTLAPGMRWSRITVPHQPEASAFLLRMGAGMELASHTHTGCELTQVLYGAYTDERALWSAGDFDQADTRIHHWPSVTEDSECICLVAVDGRVKFDGWVAKALGAWMGI